MRGWQTDVENSAEPFTVMGHLKLSESDNVCS